MPCQNWVMRGQTAQRDVVIKGTVSAGRLCFAAGVIILGLSGCGAVAGSPTQVLHVAPAAPAAPTASSPAPAAQKAPSEAPSNVLTAVTEALNSAAAQTPKPNADALRAAFGTAGVDPAAVEVSIDTTPTGLEVDAMTAAAPVGDSCIFGHVRDGVATVTQLPVLADGRCFIGDQR